MIFWNFAPKAFVLILKDAFSSRKLYYVMFDALYDELNPQIKNFQNFAKIGKKCHFLCPKFYSYITFYLFEVWLSKLWRIESRRNSLRKKIFFAKFEVFQLQNDLFFWARQKSKF